MNCKWFFICREAFMAGFQSHVEGRQRCAPCHTFTIAPRDASIVWESKATLRSFHPAHPLLQAQLCHPVALKRFDLLNWVVLQNCLLASLDSVLGGAPCPEAFWPGPRADKRTLPSTRNIIIWRRLGRTCSCYAKPLSTHCQSRPCCFPAWG